MKARIRKNQKDWHVYIFWILLGVFALLVIMDAFSEDKFDRLPLILCIKLQIRTCCMEMGKST